MTVNPVELKRTFRLWAGTPLKVRLIEFYRSNPGVVETTEGLAHRIAEDPQRVADAVRDHIELGVFRERVAGDRTVILFDRRGERRMRERIASQVQQLPEAFP